MFKQGKEQLMYQFFPWEFRSAATLRGFCCAASRAVERALSHRTISMPVVYPINPNTTWSQVAFRPSGIVLMGKGPSERAIVSSVTVNHQLVTSIQLAYGQQTLIFLNLCQARTYRGCNPIQPCTTRPMCL